MDLSDLSRARAAARRFVSEVKTSVSATRGFESFTGAAAAAATAVVDAAATTVARKKYLARASCRDRAKATVLEAELKGAPAGRQQTTIQSLSQERILGSNDLVDLNYLELAVAMSRAVARIRIGNGFGTGSLVGPRVLMTNHHVIDKEATGAVARAQFDYQQDASGQFLQMHEYKLDPGYFYFSDPELDVTFIGVAPVSAQGRPISSYPWLPLIEDAAKADKDDPLNIIQHPRGGPKQIALRNNQIIELPAKKSCFLFYTTDTEPGSSGSPCFNDQWELVALHHSGVPRMDGETVLRKNGKPYREGQDDPAEIDWIANEGARISAIVAALKDAELRGGHPAIREQIFTSKPPNPVELARIRPATPTVIPMEQSTPATPVAPVVPSGAISITIPLTVTVSLGQPAQPAPAVTVSSQTTDGAASDPLPAQSSDFATESVTIDPNWKGRPGYNPKFLGPEVPLPKLSEDQLKQTVLVPEIYRKDESEESKHIFHYHHFSLAMNRKRRFAWFSAVNIDRTTEPPPVPKRKEKWFVDPRIDSDVKHPTIQCGEELYSAANTDRGHLTRYADAVWGKTSEEAIAAGSDTFHFSNCCLQLDVFNQGKSRWQGIEQYLLEQKAKKEKRKMSVFTGPIFKRNDRAYRNPRMDYSVRIPMSFWKVCILERKDGSLAATGFVLDQDDIAKLPGFEEKFDVDAAQVEIAEIEKRTGLDFGELKKHDHFAKGGAPGALELLEAEHRPRMMPIETYDDIVV